MQLPHRAMLRSIIVSMIPAQIKIDYVGLGLVFCLKCVLSLPGPADPARYSPVCAKMFQVHPGRLHLFWTDSYRVDLQVIIVQAFPGCGQRCQCILLTVPSCNGPNQKHVQLILTLRPQS